MGGVSLQGAVQGGVSGGFIGYRFGGPGGAIVGAVIGTTLGGLGGLLGGGDGPPPRADPRTTAYQPSAGHFGNFIPVFLGTRRITCQAIQRRYVHVHGDPNSTIPQLVNADSWDVHGLVLAISQGEIAAISRLWVDEIEYPIDLATRPVADGGAGFTIQYGGFPGMPGSRANDGTLGDDGTGTLWLVTNPGIAHLRGDPADLVKLYTNPLLDSAAIEAARAAGEYGLLPEQVNSTPAYVVLAQSPEGRASGSQNCAPGTAISVLLTRSLLWGAGWDPARVQVNAGSDGLYASSFAASCAARGWEVSPLYDSQTSIAAACTEIAAACDAELCPEDGRLKVLPRGEYAMGAYQPDTEAVCDLTFDDFVSESGERFGEGEDPIAISTAPDAQVFNVVPVEFSNEARKYELDTAARGETADVVDFEERRAPAATMRCVVNRPHAEAISASIARRAIWQRRRYTFHVGVRPGSFLGLMDIVRLTDDVLGGGEFDHVPVRILNKSRRLVGRVVVYTLEAEDYLGDVTGVKVNLAA